MRSLSLITVALGVLFFANSWARQANNPEVCRLYQELRGAMLTEDMYRHAPNRDASDEAAEADAGREAAKAKAALTAKVGKIDYSRLALDCTQDEQLEKQSASTHKEESATSVSDEKASPTDSGTSSAK